MLKRTPSSLEHHQRIWATYFLRFALQINKKNNKIVEGFKGKIDDSSPSALAASSGWMRTLCFMRCTPTAVLRGSVEREGAALEDANRTIPPPPEGKKNKMRNLVPSPLISSLKAWTSSCGCLFSSVLWCSILLPTTHHEGGSCGREVKPLATPSDTCSLISSGIAVHAQEARNRGSLWLPGRSERKRIPVAEAPETAAALLEEHQRGTRWTCSSSSGPSVAGTPFPLCEAGTSLCSPTRVPVFPFSSWYRGLHRDPAKRRAYDPIFLTASRCATFSTNGSGGSPVGVHSGSHGRRAATTITTTTSSPGTLFPGSPRGSGATSGASRSATHTTGISPAYLSPPAGSSSSGSGGRGTRGRPTSSLTSFAASGRETAMSGGGRGNGNGKGSVSVLHRASSSSTSSSSGTSGSGGAVSSSSAAMPRGGGAGSTSTGGSTRGNGMTVGHGRAGTTSGTSSASSSSAGSHGSGSSLQWSPPHGTKSSTGSTGLASPSSISGSGSSLSSPTAGGGSGGNQRTSLSSISVSKKRVRGKPSPRRGVLLARHRPSPTTTTSSPSSTRATTTSSTSVGKNLKRRLRGVHPLPSRVAAAAARVARMRALAVRRGTPSTASTPSRGSSSGLSSSSAAVAVKSPWSTTGKSSRESSRKLWLHAASSRTTVQRRGSNRKGNSSAVSGVRVTPTMASTASSSSSSSSASASGASGSGGAATGGSSSSYGGTAGGGGGSGGPFSPSSITSTTTKARRRKGRRRRRLASIRRMPLVKKKKSPSKRHAHATRRRVRRRRRATPRSRSTSAISASGTSSSTATGMPSGGGSSSGSTTTNPTSGTTTSSGSPRGSGKRASKLRGGSSNAKMKKSMRMKKKKISVCVLSSSYKGTDSETAELDNYVCTPAYYITKKNRHKYRFKSVEVEKNDVYRVIRELISSQKYDLFFNLCDGGRDEKRAGVEVVHALEDFNAAFTGADSRRFEPSKIDMKLLVHASGVRVPNYALLRKVEGLAKRCCHLRFPVIVKHLTGYASVGIQKDNLCRNIDQLRTKVTSFIARFNHALVEEFIVGREGTVLTTADPNSPDGVKVFQPLMFNFLSGPEDFAYFDKKWKAEMNEFSHLLLPPTDLAYPGIINMARNAFHFILNNVGYGRVDFRIDQKTNEPVFLEINPNCGMWYNEKDGGDYADLMVMADPQWNHEKFFYSAMRQALKQQSTHKPWYLVSQDKNGIFTARATRTVSAQYCLFGDLTDPVPVVVKALYKLKGSPQPSRLLSSTSSSTSTTSSGMGASSSSSNSNNSGTSGPAERGKDGDGTGTTTSISSSTTSRSAQEGEVEEEEEDSLSNTVSCVVIRADGRPHATVTIRHSCEPNMELIHGRTLICATKRPISAGEELSIDYGTLRDETMPCFTCTCGTKNCRNIILPTPPTPRTIEVKTLRRMLREKKKQWLKEKEEREAEKILKKRSRNASSSSSSSSGSQQQHHPSSASSSSASGSSTSSSGGSGSGKEGSRS